MAFIHKQRLAFIGWIIAISIFITVFFSHQAIAEDNSEKTYDHLRIGMGLGVPYGHPGFNIGLRLNDNFEATGGYGWMGSDFHSWVVGGRMYPFSEMKKFRPRLSLFGGVVDRITMSSNKQKHGITTLDVYEGVALGGGFDWKFFRRHSLDLDLYIAHAYSSQKDKGEDNNQRSISLGYGYFF